MSGKRSVACFMHALLLPSCLSVIPTAAAVLSGFFRGRKGFSSLRWETKICLRNMAGTNFWSLLLPVGNPPWRQGGGRRVAYVLPLPLLSRVLSTVLFKTKWGEISPSPHSLFPSGRVFSAKKCAKKGMGERKELLLSSRNVRSLFLFLFLFRAAYANILKMDFSACLYTGKEKKNIKTWCLGEWLSTRSKDFSLRKERKIFRVVLSHTFLGRSLSTPKKRRIPPRCFVVLGEIGYLRHHPLPPNSLWQIFFVVPPLLIRRKGGMRRAREGGGRKGKKLRKKRRELWQLLPASAIEEGGEKKKKTTSGTFWQLLF